MGQPIWIPNQPLTFRTQSELNKYNAELSCADCAVNENYCFKFAQGDNLHAQFMNYPDELKSFECEIGYPYSKNTMEIAGGNANYDANNNMQFTGSGTGGFILALNPTQCGYPAWLGWTSLAYNQTLLLVVNVLTVQTPGSMTIYFTDCSTLVQTPLITIVAPGVYNVPFNYTTDGYFEFVNTGGNEMTFNVNGYYSPVQILNAEQLNCIELTCDSVCKKLINKECEDAPFEIALDYQLPVSFSENYVLTFEVTNCTQGFLSISGDTTTIFTNPATFAGNGFFTAELQIFVSDKIKITGNDGWDGCIKNIKISTRCVDHLFNIYDSNGQIIGFEYPNYVGDYLTMTPLNPTIWFDPAQNVGECFTVTLSSNCYFPSGYITNYGDSQSWNVPSADFVGSYTELNDSTLVLEADTSWTVNFASQELDDWEFKGNCFRIEIEIQDITQPNELYFYFFGVQLLFGSNITTPGTIVFDPVYVDDTLPGFQSFIQFYNRTGRVKIDSLKIWYSKKCLGADGQDLVSQCIQYVGTDAEPCSTLIRGGIDSQLQFPQIPTVEFGFLFYDMFVFSLREYIVIHNSKWDGKSDKYRYNNGNVKQTSASVEKKWDCTIHRVDENMHDAIAILTKLDWIDVYTIHPAIHTPAFEKYISIENDYSPNWNKNAKTLTADGSFEIVKKYSSTKYHNNNP